MAMTAEEKRAAYLGWINEETGQSFEDNEALPGTVNLALEKLMEMDENVVIGIEQVGQGGRAVKFVNRNRIPAVVMELISSFRKVKW